MGGYVQFASALIHQPTRHALLVEVRKIILLSTRGLQKTKLINLRAARATYILLAMSVTETTALAKGHHKMKWWREIRAVGFVDWFWFVVILKRDEFSKKLELNIATYPKGYMKLVINRNRAHRIDMKLSSL